MVCLCCVRKRGDGSAVGECKRPWAKGTGCVSRLFPWKHRKVPCPKPQRETLSAWVIYSDLDCPDPA